MTNADPEVNRMTTAGGLAALKNVARCLTLVETLRARGPHLPGLGVFHGYSGFGKTYAALYVQNITGALRVEVGDSWTKKSLLQNILREANQEPRGTIAHMSECAIMALGDDFNRPLIIDEADKLADKGMLELVREIHEHSQAPIVLIGEEQLPAKILQVERVHNRVLDWVPAEPCDHEDARALADLFCPKLSISDDLVDLLVQKSAGKARRIHVNLNRILEHSRRTGEDSFSVGSFEQGWFFTGEPPRRIRRAA